MSKAHLIIFSTLLTIGASAAATVEPASSFQMVTITDIGRPYTALDGACAYGKATGFNIMAPEFESAFQSAAAKLVTIAKQHGGDAIVGMQASPISETAGDRNGVLLCGTVVKFK